MEKTDWDMKVLIEADKFIDGLEGVGIRVIYSKQKQTLQEVVADLLQSFFESDTVIDGMCENCDKCSDCDREPTYNEGML